MNTNLSNNAQWVTVIVVTYNHLYVNILVVIILTSTCVLFQQYCLDCNPVDLLLVRPKSLSEFIISKKDNLQCFSYFILQNIKQNIASLEYPIYAIIILQL